MQLWRPVTGSVDCGPRSWQMAADAATRGQVRRGLDRVRELAHVPGAQTTNVYDAALFLSAVGLRHEVFAPGPWDDARDALRAGDGLVLCVSYGVLTDICPWVSGSPSFGGGHSIYLQELARGRDGIARARSFDSLYDGRRPGIPDGPRRVRLHALARAAEAFAGRKGRFWGIVVPHGQGTPGVGGPGLDDDELRAPQPDVQPWAEPAEGVPMPNGSDGAHLDDGPWPELEGLEDWDDDDGDDDLDD